MSARRVTIEEFIVQPTLVSALHSIFSIHNPSPQFASSGEHLVLLNVDSTITREGGIQPDRGCPGAGWGSDALPLHALVLNSNVSQTLVTGE